MEWESEEEITLLKSPYGGRGGVSQLAKRPPPGLLTHSKFKHGK